MSYSLTCTHRDHCNPLGKHGECKQIPSIQGSKHRRSPQHIDRCRCTDDHSEALSSHHRTNPCRNGKRWLRHIVRVQSMHGRSSEQQSLHCKRELCIEDPSSPSSSGRHRQRNLHGWSSYADNYLPGSTFRSILCRNGK